MFQEVQRAKAEKRSQESEKRQRAGDRGSRSRPPPASALGSTSKSFEEDLGSSTNPFEDRSYSFSSNDASNPFLDDIRAAASAASAVSGGMNPFEEKFETGESV